MYCPKCSQQIATEELRFCSRCGLKLDVVKAYLAADAPTSYPIPTRQSGINLGVILMFLGTLITIGVVALADLRLAGGFLLLAVTYLSILLSSRPIMLALYKLSSLPEPLAAHTAERRKEVSIGASLMFIGTLLAACAALLVPGRLGDVVFFAVLLQIFTFLLFSSRRLLQAAQELLPGSEVPAIDGPHSLVMSGLTEARKQTTGEMITPPSVTEHTTNFLEKE